MSAEPEQTEDEKAMEWLACLKESVEFMETRLTEIRSPQEVADHVHMSVMYLQRGFQIMTGYTLGEYIRNRRLYLAATELIHTDTPVVDLALKYGYDSQAGFDKAFVRFHGITPLDVRKSGGRIRTFSRLNIIVTVEGGESMKFSIEKKEKFSVVGFTRIFSESDSYEMIPKFWDETIEKYASHLMKGEAPEGEAEKYVAAHHIGEFGICIDNMPEPDRFRYMIAGCYTGGSVFEGMDVQEIDAGDWAVFDCTMKTLQQTNTAIWKEWLPGNLEYEIAGNCTVEWYSPEGTPGPDQKCQIRIPVKRRA